MNDPHTPLSTFCKFQLIWINRNGDVPYHNETCRYHYNFIYKVVLATASTCPKFKSLTLKLLSKMKIFNFSYTFDYIYPYEASLGLMVMSMFIHNIHHS